MLKGWSKLARGLGVVLAVSLAGPSVAGAAVISEVFLAGTGPAPDAVELDGLTSLSQPYVDLVVLDATENFATRVRQVVTIPTALPTLLISETTWPADLWRKPVASPSIITLADLGAGDNWSFTASRTLVLYDRKTNLTANLQPLADQLDRLNGAQVVAALTFQRGPTVKAWSIGPTVDAGSASAIVQPLELDGPAGTPLVGTPDPVTWRLIGIEPAYRVSPGQSNPPRLAHHPEPGVGTMLAAAALFCGLRRPIMDGYAR